MPVGNNCTVAKPTARRFGALGEAGYALLYPMFQCDVMLACTSSVST